MRRTIGLAMWLGVLAMGCDEGVEFGGFDGSLFPEEDAGVDAGDGGAIEPDAGDAMVDEDAGVEVDAGDAGGGPMGPDADALPGLYAEAICDALRNCLGNTLLADQLRGRDCTVFYRNQMEDGDLRNLQASIEAGLVEYHPENLDTCLADIVDLGCDVRSARLPVSCEDAVVGMVPLGEDCSINEDCEGDAFCSRGEPASCPGTCLELRGLGVTCDLDDDAQCVDGLVCTGGACLGLGIDGDSCGTGMPGCMPGTVCFDMGGGQECMGTTEVYTELSGDPCDIAVGPLCQPPLVCESVSGNAGTCQATVGLGEDCKRAVPNQCPISQYCDASGPGDTGSCVDRPMDGEACLNRSQQCADEHVCVVDTCEPLGVLGDVCVANGQCYSGACSLDGECEPLAACDAP